jgi:hypothetical protein
MENLDLTWADEDALWANDDLFIADDTYKLLYDCHLQVHTSQPPMPSSIVSSTTPSLHTPTDVISFTPSLLSSLSARHLPKPPSRSKPFDTLHMANTSPPALTLHSAPSGADCSFPPPSLQPSSYSSSSLLAPEPQASRLHSSGTGHNCSTGAAACSNHKKKCWKTRADKPCCILGCDVSMDKVLGLTEKSLIGKFFYAKMSLRHLTEWMISVWKPILGNCPRFNLLTNHWLVFNFLSESDLFRILETPWIFDKGVLMLKRW